MSTNGWRITSWSRERGRGTIESDVGTLPFDAHVADVDDFEVGEQVEVRLTRAGESFEVTRVWPKSFRPVLPPSPDAPLPFRWRRALRKLDKLLAFSMHRAEIREAHEERLVLEIIHDDWPPPHGKPLGAATFEGVEYIQLPTSFNHFARTAAWPWQAVQAHRPELVERLSLAAGDVEPDAFLVCFEPESFGVTPGFVVATKLTTRVNAIAWLAQLDLG